MFSNYICYYLLCNTYQVDKCWINLIFKYILTPNMYLYLVKYILSLEQLIVNPNHRKYQMRILREKNNKINL